MTPIAWGDGWRPVTPDHPLQRQLMAELGDGHPLVALQPRVIGRCLTCDDIAVALASRTADLAVVHLTWQAAAHRPPEQRSSWPHFEMVTAEEFHQRFVRGGEHL